MTTQFDPVAFKTTTRAQWEEAAEAWHRWGPAIEDWLGAATERMLDDVRLTPGSRVLDVAAGAGGQTLAAARRVGPSGSVLATDISPTILEYAAKVAADAGLANVSTLEADGEDLSAVADGDAAWHFPCADVADVVEPNLAGIDFVLAEEIKADKRAAGS